jgi:hypothetical protein
MGHSGCTERLIGCGLHRAAPKFLAFQVQSWHCELQPATHAPLRNSGPERHQRERVVACERAYSARAIIRAVLARVLQVTEQAAPRAIGFEQIEKRCHCS